MTEQLHQINVAYSPAQDRLLLRISTKTADEYRIWLTRRFTGILTGLLGKEMDKQGGVATVASSQETTSLLKGGALEKKYQEDSEASYPLGESGILAFRINVKNQQDGNLVLELLPEEGKGITLNLNKSLMYMMHSILLQGVTQAEWQLPNIENVSMKVH